MKAKTKTKTMMTMMMIMTTMLTNLVSLPSQMRALSAKERVPCG